MQNELPGSCGVSCVCRNYAFIEREKKQKVHCNFFGEENGFNVENLWKSVVSSIKSMQSLRIVCVRSSYSPNRFKIETYQIFNAYQILFSI